MDIYGQRKYTVALYYIYDKRKLTYEIRNIKRLAYFRCYEYERNSCTFRSKRPV